IRLGTGQKRSVFPPPLASGSLLSRKGEPGEPNGRRREMETLVALSKETQGTTEEASSLPNKYCYPEFAGWNGERYLKKLLRQILPMALYRTWEIFADHQAIGNECYLGVTRLAEIAGRTTRTMEKNLASLCAKHLLAERAERKEFCGPGNSLKS